MTAPAERWRLCAVAELDATGCKEFEYGNPRQFWGVVLRWQGELRAYVNSCPHLGLPLNLSGDNFFAEDGRHLVCAMHGALFRPEDGVCIAGPCTGDALKPVQIVVEDGAVWLVP
ncbi:MAG: Rieske 2Fe-2S domain-containing protein [Rhodospirillaceae bacterium]|nr:Rieske 2Fe-2S domain-containing protein [Rhodospirillaceae bacterium]